MNWEQRKNEVRNLLLSRNLSDPSIRLRALNNLDDLFSKSFPEILKNPSLLLDHNKNALKDELAKFKSNKKLNAAESSVINNLYQIISIGNSITQDEPKSKKQVRPNNVKTNKVNQDNKLAPIAELLCELLVKKFKVKPNYFLESSKDWLQSSPSQHIHQEYWKRISSVYSSLIDEKWTLDYIYTTYPDEINYRNQRIDIWFDAPYNFIFEFDESQHFNQYRHRTLVSFNEYHSFSFDLEHYKTLSKQKIVKPGNSGFQKLKSSDPLFPPMLKSEKQDNRPRQRAFRDFLKDITPKIKGFNPTIRMSYMFTNGKINNFDKDDLESVENHIMKNKFFENIVLG